MEHRIDLTPARRLDSRSLEPGSERNIWIGHNRYFVEYRGERIGEFRTPLCEASRHLLANGLAVESDTILSFRDGVHSMTGNVGSLAKLTIIETRKVGPKWATYHPMPEGALRPHGELLDALDA
jgi:hypothetical protein